MHLRTALLAGMLALAATALRAEEFQFTMQGFTSCIGDSLTCSGPTGPATISFDFNTRQGMASYNPGPYPPPPPDPTVLVASVPITNYLATVDGHTVSFIAHGASFGFGCFGPVLPTFYECGGGFGNVGFDDSEIWIHTVTEAEFNSFKDPLASILSNTGRGFCGGVSSICTMFTSAGNVQPFGQWTITPVPTPGPLLLFLAGLVGLALSRHRKPLGAAESVRLD